MRSPIMWRLMPLGQQDKIFSGRARSILVTEAPWLPMKAGKRYSRRSDASKTKVPATEGSLGSRFMLHENEEFGWLNLQNQAVLDIKYNEGLKKGGRHKKRGKLKKRGRLKANRLKTKRLKTKETQSKRDSKQNRLKAKRLKAKDTQNKRNLKQKKLKAKETQSKKNSKQKDSTQRDSKATIITLEYL